MKIVIGTLIHYADLDMARPMKVTPMVNMSRIRFFYGNPFWFPVSGHEAQGWVNGEMSCTALSPYSL